MSSNIFRTFYKKLARTRLPPVVDKAKMRKVLIDKVIYRNNDSEINVLPKLDEDKATVAILLKMQSSDFTIKIKQFLHKSLGCFFSKTGAQKQFALAQGITWLGEDSIDDSC